MSQSKELLLTKEFCELKDQNGQDLLLRAVCKGMHNTVEKLLKMNIAVDSKDHYGMRSLNYAISREDYQAVKLLIENGADVNEENYKNHFPLIKAILTGNLEICKLLIENGSKYENSTGSIRAITVAIQVKQEKVVDILLQKKVIVDKYSLILAISQKHYAMVQLLLERGAEVGVDLEMKSPVGDTPLITAILEGDFEITKLLLEFGASIENTNTYGLTPLRYAAKLGFENICRLLLEAGAEINSIDNERLTALAIACRHGHLNTVKVFLEYKADFSLGLPLLRACWNGSYAITKALLDAGVKRDLHHKVYLSALAFAASKNNPRTVKLLLDSGCDPNPMIFLDGDTALIKGIKSGSYEVVSLLVERGADVNDENKAGETPFNIAAERGLSKIASLLARYGARIG